MLKSLLFSLMEANGPPGYESPVRDIVKNMIEAWVDDLYVDRLGNLIARKGSLNPNGKRIMLTTHLDEVGLIVSHIDESGFARFSPLGKWDAQMAVSNRVVFSNGSYGLIGRENGGEDQNELSAERLFVDTGATNRRDCTVQVGDTAVFAPGCQELGTRIVGKALDNRVGVAVLIEVLRETAEQRIHSPHELYFVFSTQGHLGGRGSAVAAYGIEPDLGLFIDLVDSRGTPKSSYSTVEMGKGPAIRIRDQQMFSDQLLVDWIRDSADKAKISYQIEISNQSQKAFLNVQASRSGVPAAALSIPARYLHSPAGMADFGDIANTRHLLNALIAAPFGMEK